MKSFRPVATTAQERMNLPSTCDCCGREGLVKTIKMAGEGAVMWMGVGCAAKGTGESVTAIRRAAREANQAADDQESRERGARHLAEYNAFQVYLDAAAGPGDRFTQLQRLGGYSVARAAYLASA